MRGVLVYFLERTEILRIRVTTYATASEIWVDARPHYQYTGAQTFQIDYV